MTSFIAVDWGTTNRRAWRVEDGRAVDMMRDAVGIRAVPTGGFADAAQAIRDRLGHRPMLMAGMVGSNRGWADAGYLPCPATIEGLATRLLPVAPNVWIVPGVSRVEGTNGDVMRGEGSALYRRGATAQQVADAAAAFVKAWHDG